MSVVIPITLIHGQLDRTISNIISEPVSQNALFGISVMDKAGESVFQLNEQTRLIPASTFKLITTLSAYDILGANYRYETIIGYSGELLSDGVLIGDVIIVGSGDPTLGSNDYDKVLNFNELVDRIISRLKSKGIKCIQGALLIDDSIFDNRPIHPSWAWDDLTNYYTSGAWGFNIHENQYYIDLSRSNQPGDPVQVQEVRPLVPGLSIESHVVTAAPNSGDNAYIFGNPYGPQRWIEGTIPAGQGHFTIKGAIQRPAYFGAYHLYQALQDADIMVDSFGINMEQRDITGLDTIYSRVLSEIIAYANEISNNLYCEALFRTIGAQESGLAGSYTNGRQSVVAHLESNDIDLSGIIIEDGSGLSVRNRISPQFMTTFLNKKLSSIGKTGLQGLIPKAGEKGSVRNFLNGHDAQQQSWLKSGSINNVLAYAGLINGKSGDLFSICIMANGHESNRTVRKQIERIIEAIYQEF